MPKTYNVRSNGIIPEIIRPLIGKIDGQPVNKDVFFVLDSEISFFVVDCGIAHGNTTPADKSGWLYSRTNGGNDWSINFDVK